MTDVRDPDISDSPPRSMEALGFADQFLVWSVRVWAQSNNPDGTDPSHYYKLMREAFAKAGLKDTHLVFDRFMTLFTASLKRPLAFHAPNCSCLSREELFFVCLVADAQNDMLPRALGNLETYIAATGVRLTMNALMEFSQDFAREGILLKQVPDLEGPEDEFRPGAPREDMANVTVH